MNSLKRRDFFKVLGGGIVVILIADDSDAQEAGGGRRRGTTEPSPTALSAWLHIDEKGLVTCYTGKVEVGQNAQANGIPVVDCPAGEPRLRRIRRVRR
jgi:nicotinate dehydrogenase subunit B